LKPQRGFFDLAWKRGITAGMCGPVILKGEAQKSAMIIQLVDEAQAMIAPMTSTLQKNY